MQVTSNFHPRLYVICAVLLVLFEWEERLDIDSLKLLISSFQLFSFVANAFSKFSHEIQYFLFFYASVQNRSVMVFSVCLTPSDISCMVAGSSMFAITSTCRAIFSSDWITSCEHACSSTVCGLPDSTKKFVNTVSALARIQCTCVYTHVHKIERKRMQIRLEYKTEIEALKPLKILGFWRQKSSADVACSLVRTTLQKDIDSCCFFICGTRFWWSHVLPSHHFIYLEWLVVHSYLEMRTLHVIPQKWTG